MERRNFLKQNILTGSALIAGTNLFARKPLVTKPISSVPFKLNYAFHDGMFANLAGESFIDQIKFAHTVGFRSIEDNGMMDRTPEMQKKIGDTLTSLGMSMGVFVINYDNWPLQVSLTNGSKEWREKFVKYCKQSVEVAKRCNAKWMTVVPGNYDRKLSLDMQTANVIEALRPGVDILEKSSLIMVLEPLSDTPELFLRNSTQTYAICKAIKSSACKILYDIYHMQRNEGNIISHLDECWDEIAYLQIGDNPGRNEPGTGEINYRNVFQHIHNKGYNGILGMEHGIAAEGKVGEEALINAYREADNF